MNKLLKEYPSAYAIYDFGKYYGVATRDESVYLVNKETGKAEEVLLRYQQEAVELIEKAIPIWYADD